MCRRASGPIDGPSGLPRPHAQLPVPLRIPKNDVLLGPEVKGRITIVRRFEACARTSSRTIRHRLEAEQLSCACCQNGLRYLDKNQNRIFFTGTFAQFEIRPPGTSCNRRPPGTGNVSRMPTPWATQARDELGLKARLPRDAP